MGIRVKDAENKSALSKKMHFILGEWKEYEFLGGRRLKNVGRDRSTSLDEKKDETNCPE